MPEEIRAVLEKISEKSLEEQLQVAYDHAFDEFYSGEELDRLMETLKDCMYQVVACAFLTGYRAGGGSIPAHP